jgi:Asp-tRNA(Asn)/Glu-tRNA(Gln) amidotransferase A subunit family amidase
MARRAIAAGLPKGPFAGVPYLLKDVTTQLAGAPTTGGSRVFAKVVSLDDSALVADYKRAGFVIFGKTNTPEFGLVGITEPVLWGTTLNPWNPELTCGGSSGGAASAVAAGIVPAAQASDGGGSIRIPASCCGLFGFKPSRGRVSMAPQGEGWGGLAVLHAETRSVRDSAAILDASCRPETGDPYYLAPPATPFAGEVGRDPKSLRIGLITTNIYGEPLEKAVEVAVRDAAKLCEGLGHKVEEIKAPACVETLIDTVMTVVCTAFAANLEREAARRGRAIGEDEVEPITWMLYERAKTFTGLQYARAIQAMHTISREAAAWSAPYDVLLLSTLGTLPLPVGMLKSGLMDLTTITERFYKFGPNTQLFNITGQPAMSVPLAWEGNTPIGIQFVGGVGDEATLFRLAGQLEKARPWFDRTPPELP